MRNVSGYITDDGKFFEDKKQAEQPNIAKYLEKDNSEQLAKKHFTGTI